MQLRQSEAFGVLYDHKCGVRNVHADLNDRCRDENIEPACGELTHDGVFFGGLHLAVHASDVKFRERFRESFGPRRRRLEFIFSAYFLISEVDQTYVLLRDFPAIRFLDGGADDICLVTFVVLTAYEAVEPFAVALVDDESLYFLPF